jgi:hypothetical protein
MSMKQQIAGKSASRYAFGLATLVAATVSAPCVQADVIPAIAGHAWIFERQNCFGSVWAAVSNHCEDNVKYLVPVPIRRSGGTTVNVRVFSDHGGGVTCQAIVNDSSNNLVDQSARLPNNVVGIVQTIPLGTFSVPRGGTLHFDCDIDGNDSSSLINVDWTQG